MHGDFSRLPLPLPDQLNDASRLRPLENINGVMHQQGRVLLDSDWNAQAGLTMDWQDAAGRDLIGAGVAAISGQEPDSFKIISAQLNGNEVTVGVSPGAAWIDGLRVRLAGQNQILRTARYLLPPLQDPPGKTTELKAGVRDAVILEVWRESLNGFQLPEQLIEPALGAPDTTERVLTSMAFRLRRLQEDEDCHNLRDKLKDDFSKKGKLTVSLQPTTVVKGDCPVVEGGGYTGFEHNLYRIEIARLKDGELPHFKWSQFNGGLVGRGIFDAASLKVQITANLQSITSSGLNQFFLEAVEWDEDLGHWTVTYSAEATLDNDNNLVLTNPARFGAIPPDTVGGQDNHVFFRLWNGVLPIKQFPPTGVPVELRDGIRLAFDAPAAANYQPGDYWSFSVRAGEIKNPEVLIDAQPPAGIWYHRVPLAVIEWGQTLDTNIDGTIEDCRRPFRPLTDQRTCCTFLIGDGVSSFGDFNSLEEAAEHLPLTGGELCLLPGLHHANLLLRDRERITIHGCGRRTQLLPRENQRAQPIFHFIDCREIVVHGINFATLDGEAIQLDGTAQGKLDGIRIEDNWLLALTHCISVRQGRNIRIEDNVLVLLDRAEGEAALVVQAEEALIEDNVIFIVPAEVKPPDRDTPHTDPLPDPTDPCADNEVIYARPHRFLPYLNFLWKFKFLALPLQPYRAWGGIHVLGGSESIRIVENHITGGAGNGITLGGVLRDQGLEEEEPPPQFVDVVGDVFHGAVLDEQGNALKGVDVSMKGGAFSGVSDEQGRVIFKIPTGHYEVKVSPGYKIVNVEPKSLTDRLRIHVLTLRAVDPRPKVERGFLYEITIERNEISRMGLSGIGFAPFTTRAAPEPEPTDMRLLADFSRTFAPLQLAASTNLVRELVVRENRIHHCLLNPFNEALLRESKSVGRGGISLGMCEGALLVGNHIYDNGTRALDPVCGIFVGLGENLEIRENAISNNGPIRASDNLEADAQSGIRGGIYVWLAATLSFASGSVTNQRPALRVQDNRIDQPVGRALTALAFGPVACCGNHFNCEQAGPSVYDRLVGGVLLVNLGGMQHRLYLRGRLIPRRFSRAYFVNETVFTGPAKERFSLFGGAFAPAPARVLELPGGDTLFNSNQIRLGAENRSVTSQVIGSFDDVGYDGNQSWAYNQDGVPVNVLIAAHTLRASDNRFREFGRDNGLSLFTYSVQMNTTAGNQGDHCIIPVNDNPSPAFLKDDNQEFESDDCVRIRQFLAAAKNPLEFMFKEILARIKSQSLEEHLGGTTNEFEMFAQAAFSHSFSLLVQMLVLRRVQFQTELLRVKDGLGTEHYRVQKYEARLARNVDVVKEMSIEKDLMRVSSVPLPAGGIVVEGRISGEDFVGTENLTVRLVNAEGQPVGLSAKTGPSGHYSLAMDEADVERLTVERKIFLSVASPEGEEVLRKEEPLEIKPNTRFRAAIIVPTRVPDLASAQPLKPDRGGTTPRAEKPVPKTTPPWKKASSAPSNAKGKSKAAEPKPKRRKPGSPGKEKA